MSKQWNMALPQGALTILDRLNAAGHEGYVVGGCVRDALLGLTPKDYDLCTDATPEELLRALEGLRAIPTGAKHGTLTVIADGAPYEVTTYRVDGQYADHRRPDRVDFVRDLQSDLARRDFTINAMAYAPGGGLRDCFGGEEDLLRGVIRCVGDPRRRFDEDALRILRALRFAAVYGFAIEAETASAARDLRGNLAFIARERVTAEACKLICGRAAQDVLTRFADVMYAALPCALHLDGLGAVRSEPTLRLAHLFQDQPDVGQALKLLRLDSATERAVCELTAQSAAPCPQDDVAWRKLLRRLGPVRVEQLAAWRGWETDRLQLVLSRGDCWSIRQLAVSGRDLRCAGIPAGPGLGRLLDALLDAVILGQLDNTPEALLKRAKASEGERT